MKTSAAVSLVVFLALIVSSAPVLAAGLTPFGFAAIPLGDQTRQEIKVGFVNPYSVSLYRVKDARGRLVTGKDEWIRAGETCQEPIGFTYGTDLICKAPNDLWASITFAPNNLPGAGHTACVRWGGWFGLDDLMSKAGYYNPLDVRPKPKDRREAQKAAANLGYEADCLQSGPAFQAWVPTNDIPENQTTTLVMDIFGPKGKTYTRWAFWTSVSTPKGNVQTPLAVARIIAPRGWVEKAPADEILRACTGLETPWLTEGDQDEKKTTTTTTTTTTSEPAKQDSAPPQNNEASGTPRGVGFQQEQPAEAEQLAIRPDGGYVVEDRENNDRWVIRRDQRVYFYFSRDLREGERFEYGMSYIDRDGQVRWTQDAEGNPFPVPAIEVVDDHFFLTFTDPATVAPGEHTLFIRVVGPNGVLTSTTKTVVIKEDAR